MNAPRCSQTPSQNICHISDLAPSTPQLQLLRQNKNTTTVSVPNLLKMEAPPKIAPKEPLRAVVRSDWRLVMMLVFKPDWSHLVAGEEGLQFRPFLGGEINGLAIAGILVVVVRSLNAHLMRKEKAGNSQISPAIERKPLITPKWIKECVSAVFPFFRKKQCRLCARRLSVHVAV